MRDFEEKEDNRTVIANLHVSDRGEGKIWLHGAEVDLTTWRGVVIYGENIAARAKAMGRAEAQEEFRRAIGLNVSLSGNVEVIR